MTVTQTVQVVSYRAKQQHLQRERHPQLSLLLHFQAASSALLYLLLLRAVQRGISRTNYPFRLLHLYTRLMLNWGWELPFPSTPECRQQLETAPWWHSPACKSWRREKICWVHVGGKERNILPVQLESIQQQFLCCSCLVLWQWSSGCVNLSHLSTYCIDKKKTQHQMLQKTGHWLFYSFYSHTGFIQLGL